MQDILRGRRHSAHTLLSAHRDKLLLAGAVALSWVGGVAVASGGSRARLALLIAGVAGLAPIVLVIARRHLIRDTVAIELPVLLLLVSELVWRQRDADSLASNPLDAAGLYRVACVGLALALGLLALTSPVRRLKEPVTTRPFRLYAGYVVVVFIGAPLSVNLLLTAYRGVELAIGVVVIAAAYRRAGREAIHRVLALLYWFTAISAIVIWAEALAMPGTAFTPVRDSPFPVQLHGILPAVSSNGTGTIGAVLGLWSLARILSPEDRRGARVRTLAFLSVLGFVTLAFAQYRTGYAITVVGLLLLLTLRAKAAAFWMIVLGAFIAMVWGGELVREAVPVLQRGASPDTIRSLSGRLNYWSTALPVWEQSPLFGRGLLTASRYEVLVGLGSVYTSSIHGTWVEALVGTGIVGVALLGSAVLITAVRAFAMVLEPNGRVVPLLLVTILIVRSITGPTFEVAGSGSIMLMAVMMLLRDPGDPPARPSVSLDTVAASWSR